jgi:uncharacterized protein
MEIEGTYTLQAPTEEVWRCLADQQTIQHAIPGLERLAQVEEHTYAFAVQIRYAPLRGNYSGRACVLEQRYPSSFCLKIEGEGQSNQFSGECEIELSAQHANTVISYRGTVEPGRGSKLLSTALVKGAVKVLFQRFFTALADKLRSEQEAPVYVTTLEEMYEMPFMEEQLSEHLTAVRLQNPPTYLHRLVRLLRLGQRDPQKEEQWVRRLRPFGIAAVLLLLVWIGTRLPRRPAIRP